MRGRGGCRNDNHTRQGSCRWRGCGHWSPCLVVTLQMFGHHIGSRTRAGKQAQVTPDLRPMVVPVVSPELFPRVIRDPTGSTPVIGPVLVVRGPDGWPPSI
ncbi:MAG: hypothetical protein ABW185_03975 [Sedimenticola sp.]